MKSQLVQDTPIPPEYLRIAQAVIGRAEEWLADRYDVEEDIFAGFTLRLSCTAGRNWYYPSNHAALIRISSTRLYLYNIEDAQLTTPDQGLPVGVGTYISSSFIHEATHFLQQALAKPTFSELETTANQLDFIEEVDPLNFSLLVEAKGATVVSNIAQGLFQE